jgi:hypothetical protein
MKNKLTQERLKEVLRYDPETGDFTWKVNCRKRTIGDIAGTSKSNRYVRIGIDQNRYFAHRLAFLYQEGYLPEYSVDHINGKIDDNRWINLRHATQSCNLQNQKINILSASRIPGVRFYNNGWEAHITIKRKQIYLGNYDNKLEAALARYTFEVQCEKWTCNNRSELAKVIESIWPEFNRGNAI